MHLWYIIWPLLSLSVEVIEKWHMVLQIGAELDNLALNTILEYRYEYNYGMRLSFKVTIN